MTTKKVEAKPLVLAERSGTLAGGGTFRLQVGLQNMVVNGVEIDSETAAEAIASLLTPPLAATEQKGIQK